MEETRTIQQNKALHKYFQQIADSLNESGYDVKTVLNKMREGVEIAWTKEMVKEILWREIQKIMYSKQSTTELSKHQEIERIHEVLQRFLGERLHMEYTDFPHEEKEN